MIKYLQIFGGYIMARKKDIVWTKYLSERTLLRAWYVLENNYFKSTIKNAKLAQGQTARHANYSKCHNALYTGLYYPNKDVDYLDFKPIPQIKQDKNITTKSGVIANSMPPYEILKNIHAMHLAGKSIADYTRFSSKIESDDLYAISYDCGKEMSALNVKNELVNSDANALVPVQESCYKYIKKIKADLQLGKPIGTVFTENSSEKIRKFENSVKKYNETLLEFKQRMIKFGLYSNDQINALLSSMDNGLYGTMVGNLGFNFNDLMKKNNLRDYVTRKEVELHTKKIKAGMEDLEYINTTSLKKLCSMMERKAGTVRERYISTKKVYPECNKGFYNAFAEMLAMNLQNINVADDCVKNYPKVFEQIITKMNYLKKQYLNSENKDFNKEISKKLDQITEVLNK